MMSKIKSLVKNPLQHIQKVKIGLSRKLNQIQDDNFIGFDKYEKYGAYHWESLDSEEYKGRVEVIAPYLSKQSLCLDIGCGDGAYMHALSSQCKAIVGIDADYDAVRLANAKLKENQIGNCQCFHVPISKAYRKLKPIGKFHVIYSMDVIEHLPNPVELLSMTMQLVQPQGVIMIGTPTFVSKEMVSPYHVKEFTSQEMQELLSPYFKIEREILLPAKRLDGKVYAEGFYIGVCVLRGDSKDAKS